MAPGDLKGYLILTVEEATGNNKDDVYVWDNQNLEAFVKAEIRSGEGVRSVKAHTKKQGLAGTSVSWREELALEVLEGARELRLMLCREKESASGRRVPSVIAACGIYVADILDAVPIDKYFELYKPSAGGEGGYIRIKMKYAAGGPEALAAHREAAAQAQATRSYQPSLSYKEYTGEGRAAQEAGLSEEAQKKLGESMRAFEEEAANEKKGGGIVKKLIKLSVVAGAVAAFAMRR